MYARSLLAELCDIGCRYNHSSKEIQSQHVCERNREYPIKVVCTFEEPEHTVSLKLELNAAKIYMTHYTMKRFIDVVKYIMRKDRSCLVSRNFFTL